MLNRLDLDVAKLDPAADIVLKPDQAFGVLRVRAVQDLLAVQNDDEMVAVRGNFVAIPLVGEDLGGFGFNGIHQGTGLVGGPEIPDLQFVAGICGVAVCLRRTEKDAAVGSFADPELDLQLEVGERFIRRMLAPV
jgi:hypothetical protein